MYRILISLKKEALLFLNDKTGLAMMFLLPIILVIVITIIQDSVFKIVDSNKITLLIINQDKGDLGKKLTTQLSASGMFEIEENNNLTPNEIKEKISNKEVITAIYISNDFSEKLQKKSQQLSTIILTDFGITNNKNQKLPDIQAPKILFFHDPVLQENYCYSIMNILHAHLSVIENTRMIESIYKDMGADSTPPHLKETIQNNQIQIERINTAADSHQEIPSSTQHNVPAWTIFAMFFMVVSLGTNIVKERTSGSFLRIKTMPARLSLILFSKQIMYTIIAVLQVLVIFSIGFYILPMINLPQLIIPENLLGTVVVIFVCSIAAVSYAVMIGSLANTVEQSNGFGAISIIIFAALGGVWVPTFIMPNYLQIISLFSPLHWCIEGFYVLFLNHGNWNELAKPIYILLTFSFICQLVAFIKIKFEKYI